MPNISRTLRSFVLPLPILIQLLTFLAWPQVSIQGFTASSATRETEIEQKFKAMPSADEERKQHRFFTAEPHIAGSKRNNELARYIADQWREQ